MGTIHIIHYNVLHFIACVALTRLHCNQCCLSYRRSGIRRDSPTALSMFSVQILASRQCTCPTTVTTVIRGLTAHYLIPAPRARPIRPGSKAIPGGQCRCVFLPLAPGCLNANSSTREYFCILAWPALARACAYWSPYLRATEG
jgi:hypothetical protein